MAVLENTENTSSCFTAEILKEQTNRTPNITFEVKEIDEIHDLDCSSDDNDGDFHDYWDRFKPEVCRYDKIEYIKKLGPLQQFLLCKEVILQSTTEQCDKEEENKSVGKPGSGKPLCDQQVVEVIVQTFYQLVEYLATEHGVLLEIVMWLPLILVTLYIIFVEQGSLVIER